MSFFHRVTAFTSFGSIPVSDSVSHILNWWFEKLQVYEDSQQFQFSDSLFCEPLRNSRRSIDFSRLKSTSLDSFCPCNLDYFPLRSCMCPWPPEIELSLSDFCYNRTVELFCKRHSACLFCWNASLWACVYIYTYKSSCHCCLHIVEKVFSVFSVFWTHFLSWH